MSKVAKTIKTSLNSTDRDGWITDSLSKEHIIFHDFRTFYDTKYVGDATARAYVVTSRIYQKPMLLRPVTFGQSYTIQDLVKEAKRHRQVELHDNIVRFYGITKEDRGQHQYMLVFENSDGGTLCNFLKKSFKQLKWDVKLKLARQLVSAICCLHGNDIVHENLNSENVLIQGGNVKLGGFGITKKTSKSMNAISRIYGNFIQYLDPEYLKNHQEFIRNKKSDVYSVGVLLWQISSGRIPFEFEIPDFSLVQSIIGGKREFVIKGTPSIYVDIYSDCWEGDPMDRPTIQRVLKDLDEIEVIGDKTRGLSSFNNDTTFNANLNNQVNMVDRKKSMTTTTSIATTTTMTTAATTPSSFILNLLEMFKTKYQSDDRFNVMTSYLSSPSHDGIQFVGNNNSSTVVSCSTLVEGQTEKNPLKDLLSKPGTTSEIKYSLENLNKEINELILQKLLLEFIYQFYLSRNTMVDSEWLNEFIRDHLGVNQRLSSKSLLDMMLHHKLSDHFTILIGFFYEHGIGCDGVDRMKAFECYLKGSVQEKDDDLIDSFLDLKDILVSIGQYFLGLSYYKGIDDEVNQDLDKAFEWISKSSANGNLVAQCMLGYFHEHGIGTPKDETKAFEWYMKSAEGGNACGQCNVGLYYDKGTLEIAQDQCEAFKWYSKSAEGGDSIGQYNLGLCYEEGIGTVKDERKAFEWYKKSAERGNASGQCKTGTCYEEGIGVEKNENEAFEWYKKSAKGHDVLGQYNLGLCHMRGIGTDRDEKKGFELFLGFARNGNSLIQCYLEYCYESRNGLTKLTKRIEDEMIGWDSESTEGKDILTHCNPNLTCKNLVKDGKRAFEWYLKLAKNQNTIAQYYLGECFENGLGTGKDDEQAFEWYLKSAKGGDENGQYKVGYYYQKGIGIVKDDEKAFEWFLKSAKNGNSKAQFIVAVCFMHGVGTKKHIVESIMWFQKAKRDKIYEENNT